MPDGLPDDLLDDLLDEMSTPGPLGNSPYAPTRVLQPISQGLSEAAERLTSKARIALRDADTERATRFIERALDLPFDDHEEV